MSAPNCCVALVSLSIILFICNVVRGTTNDNDGTAGAAHYLQCSDQSSIHFSKVLVITFNLTKLFRPAPVTCASNCLAINRTYVYAFIHIPATNQFRNQLVCGCGFKQAIDPASALSDDFCNLACPQVPSDAMNSDKHSANTIGPKEPEEPKEAEMIAPQGSKRPEGPEGPEGPEEAEEARAIGPQASEGPKEAPIQERFNVFHGDRRRPGAMRGNANIGSNHTTCGNGRGLLSVYEIGYRSTLLFKHNKHQRSGSSVEFNNQLVLIATLILTASTSWTCYLHL